MTKPLKYIRPETGILLFEPDSCLALSFQGKTPSLYPDDPEGNLDSIILGDETDW